MHNQKNSDMRLEAQPTRWILLLVLAYCLVILPVLTHSLLGHAPEYDELLHLLAARSLNETGIPAIGGGEYPRALLYTKIVALATSFGSNELLSSRAPALLSGMLLIALVGTWLTVRVGWLAGLSAATVLALAPSTVHLSVLIRFYTLHALAVTGMAILVFEAFRPPVRLKKLLLANLIALACFLIAMQLQILTLVTALGVGAGILLVLLMDYRRALTAFIKTRPLLCMLALIASAAILIVASQATGIDVVAKLRGVTPAWSQGKANYMAFYLNALGSYMPFIWPAFPIMALAAFMSNRRLAVYGTTIIVVALLVSSLASQKATRYIYHALPIISIVWGIGFQALVLSARRALSRSGTLTAGKATALVLLVVAITLFNTEEVKRGLKLVTGRGTLDKSIPVMNEPNWLATRPELEPLLNEAEDVLVSSGVKALYAYDRYDFELNKTVVEETSTGAEFGLDQRTGRRVISSVESLARIVDDPGVELVVLENRMLNLDYSASTDVVNWLGEHCTSIALPDISQVSAWRCQVLQ